MEQHKITKIEKHKSPSRYHIHIDGQPAFTVHEDILVKYRLAKDLMITEDFWTNVLREDEFHQAYTYALKWLGFKPRTEAELIRRLHEKGYVEEAIQHCVQKLKQQHYINDAEYAIRWSEERMRVHKKGKRWIEYELRQKGIQEQYIQQALDKVDEALEWENVLALARKKWAQGPEGEQHFHRRKKRTMDYLMRRGFSFELASKAVTVLLHESDA